MAKLSVVPTQPNFEFIRLAVPKPVLCFLQIVFAIIRMNKIYSRTISPLVDGDAEILQCYVIGIEWSSSSPSTKHDDLLRSEVQYLPELSLSRRSSMRSRSDSSVVVDCRRASLIPTLPPVMKVHRATPRLRRQQRESLMNSSTLSGQLCFMKQHSDVEQCALTTGLRQTLQR